MTQRRAKITQTRPTQAQVKKAVKGALDAGLSIGRVDIGENGEISIIALDAIVDETRQECSHTPLDGIDKWAGNNVVGIKERA